MKPLYKPGDKVLVKLKYDEGFKSYDYRFMFLPKMLRKYGWTICTIDKVESFDGYHQYDVEDDGYKYYIEEDGGEYMWASSMFEPEF